MKVKRFKFSEEFTKYPGLRYISHGPHSGELFREKYLIPLLEHNDKVIVDLNGVFGFGNSFLDEAFGVLTDTRGKERLLAALTIELEDNPLARSQLFQAIDDHESKRRNLPVAT